MVYEKLIEVGRVAYVAYGPDKGKLCVIANIIDQNRALVDGPCSGVARKQMNYKMMHLTKFVIKLGPGARTSTVAKQWKAAEVSKMWEETTWAKKLAAKKKRADMTDFDRFKLMRAKQKRAKLINITYGKLKKAAKKEAAK